MTVACDWAVTHAYEDERPSHAVVRAVAAATDRSVVDLDPLHETVDTDAFDDLLGRGTRTRVSFRYAGCTVTVTRRHVLVRPDDRDGSPGTDGDRDGAP
ncbi:hypothetical protein C475_10984 [Halosimplex carlsbadense 2-9-1]|uniref:Halobacterial output domain-containing protein n=1 Tax=Halosimplex carlsbadense 2-9-1 TaxID=797114 RepID=M0CPB5_9EURY|nr:HalOD1 output domain-containing protein [Halosimplex carlsbadense]ELZ25066.1 hypothetical protein C475_10984 [Halosimplex carlsbadense 2-9-1]